jgi:REP element-mobilizing transposase RayT
MSDQERFRRRRLPHWDLPGAIYFVTTCLHGSIPAQGLLDIELYRARLARRRQPANLSAEQWKVHQWKLLFARAEDWLDRQPAVRHLEDPRLAKEVQDSVYHFAGERYDLLAYVVMPSHLHWVFQPLDEWSKRPAPSAKNRSPRERIMHSLKLHTAIECNKLLGRRGTFWQQESYDHCVVDEDELGRIIEYVEWNPVRAGLVQSPEQWPFSSARDRAELGIAPGQPLRRLVRR